MANFQIDAVSRITFEASADNVRNILKDEHVIAKGYEIEYIQNKDTGEAFCVSKCGGCGKLIVDEDIDIMSEDGDNYCKDCSDAIREDIKTHEVRCNNENCGWSGMKNDLYITEGIDKCCPRCDEFEYLEEIKK